MLAYPDYVFGLVLSGHPTGYARAGSRRRAHVHDAAGHVKAIACVLQPAARLGASRIETATVVAHLDGG